MPAHKKGGRPPKGSITCRGSIQWQARLRLDGVAHVQSFETKDKAQAWIDRLLEARKRPDRFERAVAANAMTLSEAMHKRLEVKKRLAENEPETMTGCKTLEQQALAVKRLIKKYPDLCSTVLIRLGDDDTLARELRLYLQTDRYISRKNDGAQAQATVRTFARRPYGWTEWETMLLIVRLLLKGDVQLMYEAAPLAPERAWAVINTPARWRNIDVQKRKAVGSAELQKARQLAKDVFHQIGPDGEDLLFQFLHTRLTEWKTELEKWQLMTQSGQYPGAKAIAEALAVANRQLSAANSYAAIEQFIARKSELLDAADQFAELKNFFATQKAGWDRLREGLTRFKPNQTKLEQDPAAGPALKRMQEILTAASPYTLIKEVDPLIATVQQANEQLLTEARTRPLALLQKQIEKVQHELDGASAEPDLRNRALRPLQALKQSIEQQTSLAHLYQHQQEAQDQADAGIDAVHAWLSAKQSAKPAPVPTKAVSVGSTRPLETREIPVAAQPKKPCILRPAALIDQTYLETASDVAAFISKLEAEITAALARGERVDIR